MILLSRVIDKVKSLEEENVLVVAGRGVRNEKDVEIKILSELKKNPGVEILWDFFERLTFTR
ncbi:MULTISPECIES: hypothetical protein [Blautia]|uniref:hypothetical protein n=1 Tax=Blautia TaxID=572511 RepID=UPI00156E281A|nr:MULTISPECIES: hypothetical protein [Blautia]MCC2727101.1 hypothetical protein [Blautia sp. MSK22_86]